MIVNEKFHYFTVLTLYFDEIAGNTPNMLQNHFRIWICGERRTTDKSSENSEAGMSKTYSDRVYGWLRLRCFLGLLKPEALPANAGGAADLMKAENRSPISRAFRGRLGCGDGDLE